MTRGWAERAHRLQAQECPSGARVSVRCEGIRSSSCLEPGPPLAGPSAEAGRSRPCTRLRCSAPGRFWVSPSSAWPGCYAQCASAFPTGVLALCMPIIHIPTEKQPLAAWILSSPSPQPWTLLPG